MLQIILAVLFFLLFKVSTTWALHFFQLTSYFPALSKSRRMSLRHRGSRLQSFLASSRFGAALVSSLIEFQEVQIYFVASIQIATLVSFNPSNTRSSASNSASYAGALINSITITSLSITSVSCILLIQATLQHAGMHWWYIFTTMSVTYFLAVSVFAAQGELMPSVDGLWDQFTRDSQLSECGGNPSPMTYCKPASPWSWGVLKVDAGSVWSIAYGGAAVWFVLFVDQVVCTAEKTASMLPRWLKGRLGLEGTEGDENGGIRAKWEGRWKVWRESVLGRVVALTYKVSFALLIVWMVAGYLTTLSPVVNRVDIGEASGWSFGQLVALMVWVPTVVKYLYYNICESSLFFLTLDATRMLTFWEVGIEGGFEERIAANYTITRDKDPNKPATAPRGGGTVVHAKTFPLLEVEAQVSEDRDMADGTTTDSADEAGRNTW